MGTPFLAEVRIFAFSYAPKGWALANGQTMAIGQNQALFSLLGTTYGGDGRNTFALPNLQGRVTIGFSATQPIGLSAGEPAHTLTTPEIPQHTHRASANNALGAQASPAGNYWANDSNQNATFGTAPDTALSPAAIAVAGSNQPPPNMMPYAVLSFCIAPVGISPSRN